MSENLDPLAVALRDYMAAWAKIGQVNTEKEAFERTQEAFLKLEAQIWELRYPPGENVQ